MGSSYCYNLSIDWINIDEKTVLDQLTVVEQQMVTITAEESRGYIQINIQGRDAPALPVGQTPVEKTPVEQKQNTLNVGVLCELEYPAKSCQHGKNCDEKTGGTEGAVSQFSPSDNQATEAKILFEEPAGSIWPQSCAEIVIPPTAEINDPNSELAFKSSSPSRNECINTIIPAEDITCLISNTAVDYQCETQQVETEVQQPLTTFDIDDMIQLTDNQKVEDTVMTREEQTAAENQIVPFNMVTEAPNCLPSLNPATDISDINLEEIANVEQIEEPINVRPSVDQHNIEALQAEDGSESEDSTAKVMRADDIYTAASQPQLTQESPVTLQLYSSQIPETSETAVMYSVKSRVPRNTAVATVSGEHSKETKVHNLRKRPTRREQETRYNAQNIPRTRRITPAAKRTLKAYNVRKRAKKNNPQGAQRKRARRPP